MTEYEAIFYAAFGDLSSERQIGMSIGPIPSSRIRHFIADNDLSNIQGDILFVIIKTIDAAYLNAVKVKQAKQTHK